MGGDKPAPTGDGAIPASLSICRVCDGMPSGGAVFARYDVPAPAGSLPPMSLVRDGGPVAPAAPMEIPTTWSKAGTDVLPAVPSDAPKITEGAKPTVTTVPYTGKETDAQVLVKNDGSVQYAEGFTGKEANIRVAVEPGTKQEFADAAVVKVGELQASNCCEGCSKPKLVDENHLLSSGCESKFDEAVQAKMPKPKPDGGKDGKDEDEIKPPPDNNGGDCRPGPRPKPNPDDNNIKPDGEDKVKPDKDDIDSIVNGKSKADQTRDFTTKFGDTLLKSGGLHPAYYGQFLSSFMSPKIRDLLKRLANGDKDAEKELEDALKADDGKEMKDISAGIDKQIKALTDAGDKDGAAALTGFKKQLLGDDGTKPNMAMFKEIATFQQKVEKGEAGASDVDKLFSRGDGKPNANVQKAICDLAALCAGTQRKQISPDLPAEPAARKKAIEDYQKAVKDTLIDLQIKPTAFTDLFKR